MAEQPQPELTDELIAGRRASIAEGLPDDMPRWMSRTIIAIDTFSLWTGHVVARNATRSPNSSVQGFRARIAWLSGS